MPIITEIPTLKIYHLKVEYDEITGKLRYDRKLEVGSGPAIYGLEVCKAMNMSADFLELAQNIRRDLMNIGNELVSTKKSKYNAEVFVDKCMICQEVAEDVHHIKFQSCADINKIIDGHIQKDVKSNLVPLCKSCHDKVHNKGINIYGYKQTSDGIELDGSINNYVNSWRDQSGNGLFAMSPDDDKRPKWSTKMTVTFDGSNDFMNIVASDKSTANGITLNFFLRPFLISRYVL